MASHQCHSSHGARQHKLLPKHWIESITVQHRTKGPLFKWDGTPMVSIECFLQSAATQTQAKVTFPTHPHIKLPWNMSSKTSDKCIISTSFKPPHDLNPRSKWNLPTFHFLTFLWPHLWPLIAKHLWHHIIPAMQSLGTVETQQVTKATTTTMKLQHL